MLTVEQILEDIRSSRVKTVIMDGDYAAEVDDQYTLAYALGSDKLKVIGANPTAFMDDEHPDTEATMLEGFDELKRVYSYLDLTPEEVPYFEGPRCQITNNEGFAPIDCPAVRNIIKAAHESDEIIYVITTGPSTDPVSACLLDPSIKDKICVIWLGGECVAERGTSVFHEWNLYADYRSAQILLSLDIPLVFLPCGPIGSEKIHMYKRHLDAIKGDNKAAEFLRKTLMLREYSEEKYEAGEWRKVMCDLMGVAVLTGADDFMELSVITAPVMTDDRHYAFDSTRRKVVYGIKPNSEAIMTDFIDSLNKLVSTR